MPAVHDLHSCISSITLIRATLQRSGIFPWHIMKGQVMGSWSKQLCVHSGVQTIFSFHQRQAFGGMTKITIRPWTWIMNKNTHFINHNCRGIIYLLHFSKCEVRGVFDTTDVIHSTSCAFEGQLTLQHELQDKSEHEITSVWFRNTDSEIHQKW